MTVINVRIDVPNLKVLNLSNTCCFAAFQGFLCVDHQLNSIGLFILIIMVDASMFEDIKYGSCCSIMYIRKTCSGVGFSYFGRSASGIRVDHFLISAKLSKKIDIESSLVNLPKNSN